MQEELKHLFKTKEYAQCASLSEQVIRNAPDEYVGYVYKCLSLLALGRDEEAVSIAGKAIQLSSPRINGRLWRLISRAVNRFGKDPQTIKSFWVSCNSANENAFNSSMSHLLNADVERAISSL